MGQMGKTSTEVPTTEKDMHRRENVRPGASWYQADERADVVRLIDCCLCYMCGEYFFPMSMNIAKKVSLPEYEPNNSEYIQLCGIMDDVYPALFMIGQISMPVAMVAAY